MSTIILIRGNSGSGKTSVAKELHELLGEGNLLISQDYVRRSMLSVKDEPMNLAIGLIEVQMRNWFLEYDVLGIQDERVIFEDVTKKEWLIKYGMI